MLKKILFTFAGCLMVFSHPFAEGSRGTSAATFLEMGIGSRSTALGEAYTSWTEDINGMYYNPASLATLKYPEISVFHNEYLTDSRLENMTGTFKLWKGFFGVGSTLFWVPPFDKIDIDGNTTGKVSFYNMAFNTAYGVDLNNFYLGVNTKMIYEKIDVKTYAAAAFDAGIIKSFYMFSPFKSPSRNFFTGLSFQNVGTRISGSDLPRKINAGVSYIPTEWLRIGVDMSEYFIRASDLYDFTYGFDESFQLKTGLEFNYQNLIFFRGGYRLNDTGRYTAGVGVNYAVGDFAFALDSAVCDSRDFGAVYSVNFTVKLIPKVVTVRDIRRANEYYQKGLKEYVADDLDGAIKSFEKTKDYNPYHKNIDNKIQDLEELKKIKEKNEEIEKENQLQ